MTRTRCYPDRYNVLSQSMKFLLRHWYRKRFLLRNPTSSLMEQASDQQDRRALGIVALMDVNAMTMSGLMDAEEFQFVRICHDYLESCNDIGTEL